MIRPVNNNAERLDLLERVEDRPVIPKLTSEDIRQGLQAPERAVRHDNEILVRRGGKPFPASWHILNEMRDERTRQFGE